MSALALAAVFGGPVVATAQHNYLHTDYQNYWFASPPAGMLTNYYGPGLTNAGTAVFGGHSLGDTNNTLPSGGGYGLEWSSFGQSAQGIQSDVALGETIVPPPGTDTNRPPANFVAVEYLGNTNAYYQCTNPVGGAFYVPSSGQIIAAQPNNITIDWWTTNGTINRQVLNVNAIPPKRPARFFWTEEPYNAPVVDLAGLFPIIHYNTQVPPPIYQVLTNYDNNTPYYVTNIVSGVWIENHQLHAKNVTGLFIIEYYEEGAYERAVQPDGIEIVQVLPPDLQLVKANVGSRLMPVDTYWANLDGINGVLPNVTKGQNDTAFVYAQTGPKNHWVFGIKRTWSEPWTLEIYWQHKGRMGVVWPYEVDWYSCQWPPYPQRYIVGDNPPADSAPVLISDGLSAELMEDMDPPLHATMSASGRSFSTTQPGTCLVRYTTTDNIWFEVVRTVSHTNEAFFNLDPVSWPIGEELTPGDPAAHALRFSGTNDYVQIGTGFLNRLNEWTLALWFNADTLPTSYNPVLYSEGDTTARLSVQVQRNNHQLMCLAYNTNTSGTHYVYATSTNLVVTSNSWHYVAVTYSGGSDTNGTLALVLDGQRWDTNHFPRLNFNGDSQAMIGAYINPTPNYFFDGKFNGLRLWSMALTDAQIRTNCYFVQSDTRGSLIANFPFYEGQGDVIHNLATEYGGTIYGSPQWCYGQFVPTNLWTEYPGYIHLAEGDRYNIERYAYPTEANPNAASYVFGVNTGQLEVWWANRGRFSDMPAVYYPSRVMRYTNVWPDNPPQMAIASGLGSSVNSTSGENALSFDGGSNRCATVPNNLVWQVGNELTVEAWVKLGNPSGNQEIVSWASGNGLGEGKAGDASSGNQKTLWKALATPNAGFLLGVCSNAVDAALWTGSGGHGPRLSYQGIVPTNTWTHIGYTFKAGDRIIAYVNGRAVGSTNVPDEAIHPALCNLLIGRASWSDTNRTVGAIGEVRIWNVARSAADMEGAWRTRLNGNELGLVACYPFVRGDDPAALTDAGLFGLNGTITNATWISPGRPVAVPGPLVLGAPSIYFQNDTNLPGYNPNEEHALMLDGVAYALRNDLNKPETSKAYVLVDYLDPDTGHPKMLTIQVVATNQLYSFERDLVAGLPIQPIMPLGAMPLCTRNRSEVEPPLPPAWRDRKNGWWAVSAGDYGGTADAVMYFYYQMEPTFWFPDLPADGQPIVGMELPWLPDPAGPSYSYGTNGSPVPFVYHVSWPEELPELKLGQTLTLATHGLPDVWDQLSVEVRYDQSVQQGTGESVTLFDPLEAHGTDLDYGVIDALIQSQLARQDVTGPLIRFPSLPPSIYPRLYYLNPASKRGADTPLSLC